MRTSTQPWRGTPLATLFKPMIMERQRKSFKVRCLVAKKGGVEAVARAHAQSSVKAYYITAFPAEKHSPFGEPFICSFCSHANDHPDEQKNGLLSQWRGYGCYALVFDTRKLDELLALECRAHFWANLNIERVVYWDGLETLEKVFPDLLKSSTTYMSKFITGQSCADIDLFTPFYSAAPLLKHRGFSEEREVRIVACPRVRGRVSGSWQGK
jgi:hypothetical protein